MSIRWCSPRTFFFYIPLIDMGLFKDRVVAMGKPHATTPFEPLDIASRFRQLRVCVVPFLAFNILGFPAFAENDGRWFLSPEGAN